MRFTKFFSIAATFAVVGLMSSCDPDEDVTDGLDVPSTYSFTRDGESTVNYTGQTNRGDMLAQMTTLMKTGNTLSNAAIDAQQLLNMFRNENNPFSVTYAQNLSDKCFQNDVDMFEGWLTELAANSAEQQNASEGNAGVLAPESDPTTGYLVNENGIELTQLVEKGLMGAVFYFQAMEVYLSEERMGTMGNDDLVEEQNYTNMEHYFDEAFGYFGAPVDFPSATSIDDARYWAKYTQSRNNGQYEGISDEIATAFRTARAAIVAKDYDARDEAIKELQEKWAIVAAATAVDYLAKGLNSSGSERHTRHHALSEAIAFTMSLTYHANGGNSKFPPVHDNTLVEDALDLVGPETNLYQLSDDDINAAITKIKAAFPAGVIK